MKSACLALLSLAFFHPQAFALERGYDPKAGTDGLHILDLKRAADIAPASATAHNDLGIARADSGELYEAIDEFERAYRLCPEDAAIAFNLGVAHARVKNYPKALEHLGEAVALCPDNPAALFNMGLIHLDMGMPGAAAAELERALLLDPGHPLVHYNLAVAYEHNEKGVRYGQGFPSARALEHYRAAIEEGLDNVAVRYNMGVVESKTGDFESAAADLAKACEFDAGFVPARRDLALALIQAGKYHRALRELEQAMAFSDDRELSRAAALAHTGLGRFYVENGDYGRALTQFEMALQHDETDATAHLNIARINTTLGNYDRALRSLNAAAEGAPALDLGADFAKLYFLRGAEFEKKGYYRLALSEYRKAVGHKEDFVLATLAMGELCAGRLGLREEAARCFRRCLELEPEGTYSRQAEDRLRALTASAPADE